VVGLLETVNIPQGHGRAGPAVCTLFQVGLPRLGQATRKGNRLSKLIT